MIEKATKMAISESEWRVARILKPCLPVGIANETAKEIGADLMASVMTGKEIVKMQPTTMRRNCGDGAAGGPECLCQMKRNCGGNCVGGRWKKGRCQSEGDGCGGKAGEHVVPGGV